MIKLVPGKAKLRGGPPVLVSQNTALVPVLAERAGVDKGGCFCYSSSVDEPETACGGSHFILDSRFRGNDKEATPLD